MTAAPSFTAWLDDFFHSYYRHRPVNATFIGAHDYDNKLPDFSESGVGDMLADIEILLARLARLPDEPLTATERLDRELAQGFLEIQRWESGSEHFQRGNPNLYTGEAIFGVISLFLRPYAPLEQRVDAAISRLDAIPALLSQARENVRSAPQSWVERAIGDCHGALAFLTHGIPQLTSSGTPGEHLQAAASRAASAFEEYRRYLATGQARRSDDQLGCGDEAFALLLERGHFLPSSAAGYRREAEERFAAHAAYLAEHAADFGAATPQAALAQLADLHPSPDDYYRRYGDVWQAMKNLAEERELVTWPEYPIRYVPQYPWAREAAPSLYFLFYRAPAAFDQIDIVDYLVTPVEPEMGTVEIERRLRATNDSVIKLNHVVHHGGLGHQVQNWYAYNRAESRIGQIAAVDCASRIAMFCGGTLAEGWSSYSVDLMEEVGFLTPLEQYAQMHGRLRMAARTIVEVGLHVDGWTLDQAITFYRDRVGMSPGAAKGEAIKNSMFPGAALMYLAGTQQIHALRRELATRQGSDFSLRAFHDRFLSYGSIPVSLIAGEMLAKG